MEPSWHFRTDERRLDDRIVYPPAGLVEQSPGRWSYGITWYTWSDSRTVTANLRSSPLEAYEAALSHAIRLGWRPRRWWQWWRRNETEPCPPAVAVTSPDLKSQGLNGSDCSVADLPVSSSSATRRTLH